MMIYACPSCRKTLQSPEEQAGTTIACLHCKAEVRVPVPGKGGSGALPWVIGLGVLGIIGCGLVVIVCLAAISVLGSNASGKFNTVADSIGGPGPAPKRMK